MAIFNLGITNTKTVDGVLSAFRTAISDLKDVATEQTVKAAVHGEAAAAALSAKAAAEAEAERATTIAQQMQAVFG